MTLFLTGASGFLGKNFIQEILKKIYNLCIVTKKEFQKRIKWLKGDLDDDWSNVLKETDIFIHFASSDVKNLITKRVMKQIFLNLKKY